MAILKTITTTTPIVDADGVNAFGWLRVRPNAPFEYTDGGAISVTDSVIECQLVDGAIYAVGGVVSADLSLAPNTGASNSPETYYIVDLELNGTTDRQYWRIDSATGGGGSVDVEYVDVPRVPGPDTGSSDTLSAHLATSNPHQQYALRSDTVAYGETTTGAASDGLGKIPRCNTSTGKLDPSITGEFASGVRLLFQQTSAPTGWTKDTAATYNGAMIVGTTGSVASGGSADPTTMAHGHSAPSHTLTTPAHVHRIADASEEFSTVNVSSLSLGAGYEILLQSTNVDTDPSGTGAGSGVSISGSIGAIASASISPKYFSVIVASKN